jgi:hypothetical protein
MHMEWWKEKLSMSLLEANRYSKHVCQYVEHELQSYITKHNATSYIIKDSLRSSYISKCLSNLSQDRLGDNFPTLVRFETLHENIAF